VFKEYMAKQKGAGTINAIDKENEVDLPKRISKGRPKGKKGFKVERILDQKEVGKRKMEYFVKWKGYSAKRWVIVFYKLINENYI
jgi:hypothetical protein